MKIKIGKKKLENAINILSSYVDKKDNSGISSHIAFKTYKNENKLELYASDGEIGLKFFIKDVNISEDGFSTVNAKNISDVLKTLEYDEIDIECINDSFFVKQNKTKCKLPIKIKEYITQFPTEGDFENFNVDSVILSIGFKKVLPAIDNQNMRQCLNGCLIDIKENKINFVGSDTKRLALYEVEQNHTNEKNFIIPKRAINEISKLLFEKSTFSFNKNFFLAKGENYEFFTKLINDNFPTYEKLFPKETMIKFELKRDEFLNELKKINAISEFSNLNFKKDRIIFESIKKDNSNIEVKTEIEINLPLEEEFNINIKTKLLIDFLQNIETDIFLFEMVSSNHAFVVSSQNYKTIIMPVNL